MASSKPSYGRFDLFLLEKLFQIVFMEDPSVEEHHRLHTHFQDGYQTYLVYFIVTCPIYLLDPWWIQSKLIYNETLTKHIVDKG